MSRPRADRRHLGPAVAIWGAIFGFVAQWSTRGQRDFASQRGIVASRYDVVVAEAQAERARTLLAQAS